MKARERLIMLVAVMVLVPFFAIRGGPYTEQGVNSHVGLDGRPSNPMDLSAVINPIFRGWATVVVNYEPTPNWFGRHLAWFDPSMALGTSGGNTTPEEFIFDVTSLGDLDQNQINAAVPQGRITLAFDSAIFNGEGYDFAVFENGMGPICNDMLYWIELGYVEVSTNGVDFERFPSVSLVPYNSGEECGYSFPYYRLIDITDVYNLAGKHPNLGNEFNGTPFDLSELVNEPNVLNGSVDINNINYVRIVDIPGSGDFFDEATHYGYAENHPIYDPWTTIGSDGMDLEAIGILHPQEYSGDINLDGIVDYEDLEIFAQSWLGHFGQDNYLARCDMAKPKDLVVDFEDYAAFAGDWGKVEQWR